MIIKDSGEIKVTDDTKKEKEVTEEQKDEKKDNVVTVTTLEQKITKNPVTIKN